MKKISIAIIALCTLTFTSCDDEDYVILPEPAEEVSPVVDDTVYTSGNADFSTFVSVGNSLTAGYSDGALFVSGQENSFPSMLAAQFALAGGGTFSQPLMNDDLGGLLLGGNQITENRFYLKFDAVNGNGPVRVEGTPTTEVSATLSGLFNNMGVPGAKSFHLGFSGYGNIAGIGVYANPYFARMATSPGATIMGDVMAQSPTFFSLWIGHNDVLSYAAAGGDGKDQLGNYDPATYGGNDITDPIVFGGVYQDLLQGLTSGGAKGVLATIPNVTNTPYFTTVPYNPLDPTTNEDLKAQIPTINMVYGALNQIFIALGQDDRVVEFSDSSANPVVIKDEYLTDISAQIEGALMASPTFIPFIAQFGLPAEAAPLVASLLGSFYGQSRPATEADLIVLPSMSIIGTINMDSLAFLMAQGLPQALAGQFSAEGITLPLADKWVLTPTEQEEVTTAQVAYNQTITALAAQHDLALFDAESLLTELVETGITQNGITSTAVFATGGGFSLDGIHPSPRGYAIIANGMIDEINATYQSNLPTVNVGNYKGVYIK